MLETHLQKIMWNVVICKCCGYYTIREILSCQYFLYFTLFLMFHNIVHFIVQHQFADVQHQFADFIMFLMFHNIAHFIVHQFADAVGKDAIHFAGKQYSALHPRKTFPQLPGSVVCVWHAACVNRRVCCLEWSMSSSYKNLYIYLLEPMTHRLELVSTTLNSPGLASTVREPLSAARTDDAGYLPAMLRPGPGTGGPAGQGRYPDALRLAAWENLPGKLWERCRSIADSIAESCMLGSPFRSRGNSSLECSTDVLTLVSESTGSHEPVVRGSCRR